MSGPALGHLPTILSLLDWGQAALTAAQIPDGRFEAELLLARVTGLQRIAFHREPDQTVSEEEKAQFHQLIKRRLGREPVQHLIEEQEFWGKPFWTPAGVFIPRPETELLIEGALDFFQNRSPEKILELGTGTGCVAITLSLCFPSAKVFAVDRSDRALSVARQNAERQRVAGRVHLLQADLGTAFRTKAGGLFDLIVSNPPYLAEDERKGLQPEVAEHDPPEALFAGPSGMEVIDRILAEAPRLLAREGSILLEFGALQGEKLRHAAQETGFGIRIRKDYAGLERTAHLMPLDPFR